MSTWDGTLPDEEEDEDDEIPEELRDRWARRDSQYMGRSVGKFGPLMPGEIAAIRDWRAAEAEEIENAELVREARLWEPPL